MISEYSPFWLHGETKRAVKTTAPFTKCITSSKVIKQRYENMLDFIGLRISDQSIINAVVENPLFQPKREKKNAHWVEMHHTEKRISVELYKSMYCREWTGEYSYAYLQMFPHYHYNNDQHNGNDFSPQNCIKILREIMALLRIQEADFPLLKVINLEFGLNILPNIAVEKLIEGILYTKRTPFVVPNRETPYFKKSEGKGGYKIVKAYAKGLQFVNSPHFGIDRDMFRFEIRTKEAKKIRNLGINTFADLLRNEVYNRLASALIEEWKNVLLLDYRSKNKGQNPKFWAELLQSKDRNKFNKKKRKYEQENSLKKEIEQLLIQEINRLKKGANSTGIKIKHSENIALKTAPKSNWKKGANSTGNNIEYQCVIENVKNNLIVIKVENAPFDFKKILNTSQNTNPNARLCKVTGLNISMQKPTSKFVNKTALKYYKENNPKIYKELRKKYLKKWVDDEATEFYYIAHNIRDAYFNPKHNPINNRKRYEALHYPKGQLSFNF